MTVHACGAKPDKISVNIISVTQKKEKKELLERKQVGDNYKVHC